MIKILFVCHGNICRSPMAKFILKDLVEKEGLSAQFYIDSAATSTEEIGNPIYPPAKRKLKQHGILAEGHQAKRMQPGDYQKYDYLLGMEQYNIRNMMRILGGDPQHKVCRLLDFASRPRDIDDPWYSGDFETAYQDILEGCQAFLEEMKAKGKIWEK